MKLFCNGHIGTIGIAINNAIKILYDVTPADGDGKVVK